MRRDVFQAISDPTRRKIIRIVAHRSLNLNAVAAKFDISRPAISRHIRILAECGLVVIHEKGRERFCQASLKSLGQVAQWIEPYRIFWTSKLDALETFLKQSEPRRNTSRRKGRHPGKRKNGIKS